VATVISARNALDDAREALTQITGKTARDLKPLREHIPMNPPAPDNLQAWVDMALSNNPALLASEQQVKSASDSVKAAYGAHLPTLSAQLSYTRNPGWADQNSRLGGLGEYHTNSLSRDTAIGVVLSIPIFSGFATQSRVHQAIYNRESARDVLAQNRRALVRSTRNAFRSVLSGIASVEPNKAAVVSSKSSLEATQAGYEVGTQTIVDVLLAQQTLFQSQSAYSQARYTLLLNRLSLAYDGGKLGYTQLQEINALLQ
jgi:outer membrane protein